MAFNSLTSPLTFANTQANWSSMTNGVSNGAKSQPAKAAPAAGVAPPVTTPKVQVATPKAPAVYVDPYAKWGGRAGYDRAVGDYSAAKTAAYNSIGDVIGDTGNKLNSSVLDFLGNLTKGQRAIDQSAVQNEMGRIQGRSGVMDMVGQGLRSGGVMLNNRGSTNSSAGEQLAKAYSDIGRRGLSEVGNEYALGNENIMNQQLGLDEDTATFQRHYGENKTSAVNSIVQDASSKLAGLNAAAQNASLAERIDIENEKARIRNDALSRLSAYDAVLQQGVSGTKAASADVNRAKATELINAGTAPENSFNFTTATPAEFQNTGPFSSPLQVFSYPGKKKTAGA